jgi:hypothetical protein
MSEVNNDNILFMQMVTQQNQQFQATMQQQNEMFQQTLKSMIDQNTLTKELDTTYAMTQAGNITIAHPVNLP